VAFQLHEKELNLTRICYKSAWYCWCCCCSKTKSNSLEHCNWNTSVQEDRIGLRMFQAVKDYLVWVEPKLWSLSFLDLAMDRCSREFGPYTAGCRCICSFRPVVNFINILCESFSYKSLFGKKLLYEKCMRKMLMKLTPVVNFINILGENFLYESSLLRFSLVMFWLWNFLAQKYVPKRLA